MKLSTFQFPIRVIGSKNSGRLDIQILRGVCVLAVIAFHGMPNTYQSGYLGVDVFFVISGYLITPKIIAILSQPNGRRKANLFDFYWRRYLRLAPALGFTTVVFSLWLLFFGPLAEQRYGFIQAISALMNVANYEAYRLSQGNYFRPNPNGLLHTWSLSVETQIYLVFPLLLLLLQSVIRKRSRIAALIVTVLLFSSATIIFITQLKLNLPWFISDKGFWYFSFQFRLIEFIFGAIIALIKPIEVYSRILKTISLITLIYVLISPISTVFSLPVALILAWFYLRRTVNSNRFSRYNPVTKIGNASYSIYLVHLPLIYVFESTNFGFDRDSGHPFLFQVGIFSILIGQISYKLIEVKLRKSIGNRQKLNRYKVLVMFSIIPIIITGLFRVGSVNYFWMSNPPKLVGTINCEQRSKLGFCGEISNSLPNYLLVGDSHAAALSKTFISSAISSGVNPLVMYGRGCPLISEIKQNQNLTPCEKFSQNVYQILETGQVNIFIAQRSSEGLASNSMVRNSLMQFALTASKNANKVNVIGPNPEFKPGRSQGKLRDLFYKNRSLPKEEMLAASFEDYEIYSPFFAASPVSFIDSIDLFCDGETCSYKINNEYLFWDSNHISEAGASLYDPVFRREFLSSKKVEAKLK